MSRRCTILIDDDVWKSLRRDQAAKLAHDEGAISFSTICNETLKRGLRMKK